ncbi:MAG: signal peptide peptidase SppA [Bacteroidia bacterium]|nr:MAG: signal peptide peptidase SppA [Bacteroidia bacterium]
MKQFFGGCLGAFFGVVVGFIILAIVLFAAITKSVTDAIDSKQVKVESKESIEKNAVLKLELKGEIKDVARKDVWNFNFRELLDDKDLVLSQMVRTIEVAAKDENIRGLYIRIYPFSASVSQLEELRKALQTFKKSGKWIYVYADNYFQGDYYLASVADKIILNPQGHLMWKGLASQISFFKKMLEKLDIQVQIFRHGKFKSAVEPFMLDKMSEENRQQMRSILNSVWGEMLEKISESRHISKEKLHQLANELAIKDAESALQNKFIDVIADEQNIEKTLQKLVNSEDNKNFVVNYHKYKKKANEKYDEDNANKIAVIYAGGQIIDYIDGTDDEVIVPSKFLKLIDKVKEDKKVKAVVIRVNSPGGSAFASETIWQAIEKLKKKKPVIVSFGEVAASGGYYISCGADYIFTDHNTITGSIGVFGMLPNIQNLMQKDLGIYVDTVKTNTYADFMSVQRPVQPREYEVIMHSIEKVYDTFLDRVSKGRKLDKSYVDNIGQGRVWSGADAVKLKLADEIGTLEDAIAFAAKKVNLEKFDVVEYPKAKDPFQQLMESFNQEEDALQEKWMKAQLGKEYKNVWILKQSLKQHQPQYFTLLPYEISFF